MNFVIDPFMRFKIMYFKDRCIFTEDLNYNCFIYCIGHNKFYL